MFADFVMAVAVQEFAQKEIKLEEEPVELNKNAENRRSDGRNEDEKLVKFTENISAIKNELEIGDNTIYYNSNLKVEYLKKEGINDDVEPQPFTTIKHNDIKKYIYQKCKFETNRSNCLNEHLVVHKKVKQHECEVCKKTFRRATNLRDHRLIHVRDIKFLCGHCDYKTYQRNYLLRHLKNNHSNEKNRGYECSLCGFQPKEERYLKQHIKTHLVCEDKEFKCSQCNYQASIYRYLKAHVKVKHGDVKEYTCSKCEYRTTVKCNMNVHLISHDNYRPYECNVCRKKFKTKSALLVHASVHSEERRFHCAHCDYKSNKKATLERHLKGRHFKQQNS